MQSACRPSGSAWVALQAVLVDDDDLAGADVALVDGADQVERARLGGEHPVVARAGRARAAGSRAGRGSASSFPSESATTE